VPDIPARVRLGAALGPVPGWRISHGHGLGLGLTLRLRPVQAVTSTGLSAGLGLATDLGLPARPEILPTLAVT
jgi:hypothetical protein